MIFQKKTILIFKILMLLSFTLFLSCEDNFKYEKLKISGKSKSIEVLSNDFVIDSIIIENNKKVFLKASLLESGKGSNIIHLNSKTNGYLINNQNLNEMCYEDNVNSMFRIVVVVRNKKYYDKTSTDEREFVQKFNCSYFPCNEEFVLIDANKRR